MNILPAVLAVMLAHGVGNSQKLHSHVYMTAYTSCSLHLRIHTNITINSQVLSS